MGQNGIDEPTCKVIHAGCGNGIGKMCQPTDGMEHEMVTPMNAERWQEIKRLCGLALEMEPAKRETFLAEG